MLAWYFGPEATAKFGLKNFEILDRMSMHSTGKENFTVFIYYKTKKLAKPEVLKTAQTAASEKTNEMPELKDTISQHSAAKRKRTTREQPTPSASKERRNSARLASSDKKLHGKNGRK